MIFFSLKQRLPIKPFMIGCLVLLLLYSSWILYAYDRLWRGAAIVILYATFDVIWTYLRDRAWYIPSSSWISGLILALVGTPSSGALGLLAIPFVAVFSKQVIYLWRIRHIFNPAAFSLAVFAFLGALHPTLNVFAPTWWGIAWINPAYPFGGAALWLMALVGVVIWWRQARFHIVLSFVVLYSATLFMIQGVAVWRNFWDSTLIFFMAVMLIEPITSSFPLRRQRMIFGGLVAVFAGILAYFASTVAGFWFLWLDPFIGGLLLGNLVAGALFLPRRAVA